MEAIKEIQNWYIAQCDEDWEHMYGIRIETLDNPGWLVYIDIAETDLEYRQFEPVNMYEDDNSWMEARVVEGRFRGVGDPSKLGFILEVFLNWSRS